MKDINLDCNSCNHNWIRRGKNNPKKCPSCNNPNWDKDIMIKSCRFCYNEFSTLNNNKMFCNPNCRNKFNMYDKHISDKRKEWQRNDYKNNSEKYIKRAKKWAKKNPERYIELQKKSMQKYQSTDKFRISSKKYYINNKEKCNSRTLTAALLKRKKWKNVPLHKLCKKCLSSNNLELHHEIYPTNTNDIVNAIKMNKIYYLCLNCHGRKCNHIESS